MSSILRKFVLAVVLTLPMLVLCQTVDPNYEVATWQGFTEAAVSYTFDDNTAKQYSVAIPMLNEFGFTGTFYPVINWGPQWTKFQAAVDLGHEIGSHSVSHPDLSGLELAAQEEELKNSHDKISSSISGQNGLTLAYPFCIPSDPALTGKYYFAARHCQGQIEKSTPSNFYAISSIICGDEGSIQSTENFISKFEAAAKASGWTVYLLHGIDGDGGYSSLSSSELRGSLEFLDANRDRFWVSTFGNVVRYIRERNDISVTELEIKADTITLEVTDTLNDTIYNHPVTLRRMLPEGWRNATVVQNNEEVHDTLIQINASLYLEFDVVPDAGSIKIQKADFPAGTSIPDATLINIFPNPFPHNIQISTNGAFEFRLFSISGNLVHSGQGRDQIWIGDNLRPGLYFLHVSCNNGLFNQKIVKL